VLPSESLYGLNFETLIVPDPKPHFWIEDVTVTTADLADSSVFVAIAPRNHEGKIFCSSGTRSNPTTNSRSLPIAFRDAEN